MAERRAVTRVSIDHEEIRRWAEERGAMPARVKGVRAAGPGIITLDFPGFAGGQRLEHVDWDEWFNRFDESNLALLFQDTTARGVKSNFNKLVSRESIDLTTGKLKAIPRRRRKQIERVGRPLKGERRYARLAARIAATKKVARKAAAKGKPSGTKRKGAPRRSGGRRPRR